MAEILTKNRRKIPINIKSLSWAISLFPILLFGQPINIGIPPLRNFNNKEYQGGTQNWQITQDKRGVIYVANNEGLLEFDGNHWRSYPIANGTNVRSVELADDGKIYVGGQGEIGYFSGNEKGILIYHSLNDFFSEQNPKFEDVWDIVISDGAVYFMSWKMIIKWEDEKISVPLTGEGYLFFEKVGKNFYLQKANFDFGFYENTLEKGFQKIASFSNEITSILPITDDTLLITTDKNGIFQLSNNIVQPWLTQNDEFLRENTIFCSNQLPNGHLVLGTTSAGVLVLDEKRRILQQVSREDNLQNNTVLSVFADDIGNLWLGLDNGIGYVKTSSSLTTFFPDGNLEGTCYTAEISGGNLYTGTNTGIYEIPWKPYYLPDEKRDFKFIAHSEGQVWSIAQFNGQLFAGHQNGPLSIKNQQATVIADLLGVWRFLPIEERYLIAGYYGGLALFQQVQNGWEYQGALDGLDESSRLLAFENGQIWMAHPYRGIFKIDLHLEAKRVDFEFFGKEKGLPLDFNNHLFQLSNKIVFTGEKGIFYYDKALDRFVPDEPFNEIFGANNRVKYLREDARGNIWYVVENEVGILWVKDDALDKQVERMDIPELTNKLVGGFEFILPIDEKNVLLATERGFIHFDPSRYQISEKPSRVILSEVWLKGDQDSLLFGGYFQDGKQVIVPTLTHQQNAFEFVFSATDHEGQEFIQYANYLEGSINGWSGWTESTSLNINNLRPGNYTLHLKAKNKSGIEGPTVSYQFEIKPPWYASSLAYTCYGITLIGAFIGLAFFQNKKHEKEKAQLENTHLQEQEKKEALVQQSKEKINLLERQKLEAEVQFKNQELAAATMNLLQKSEMMSSIEASLERLKKQDGKRDDIFGEINRLLKLVKKENDLSQDWERFSIHFDEVHSDFLKRLGEQFPNLSPNDYKLSAYLKMNLSTKEIAALMNISVRGVEASRYRLRKRLGLGTEVNLTEFLLKL